MRSNDYYPFGKVMPDRSNNTANPNDNYKFIGEELDDEAGLTLMNLNARMYDPVLARFLQVDPFAPNHPGFTPYGYSANNPLRFSDRTGLDWYLDLYRGRVEWHDGSPDLFDQAKVNIGYLDGKNTSRSAIQNQLTSLGYSNYLSSTGEIVVNTSTQYRGWIMMQTINAETIGTFGGLSFLGGNLRSSRSLSYFAQYQNSAIAGLTRTELQRLNVANAVKLGKMSADDASRSVVEGGAATRGVNKSMTTGKMIEINSAGSGNYSVTVNTYSNGQLMSSKVTSGSARELGITNAAELVGKGKPYNTHWIGIR